MIGLSERDTKSGIHVFRVHYTADPMKRDERVLDELAQGVLGGRRGRAWRREMEIDWTIASGVGVYSEAFARELHVAAAPLMPHSGPPMQRGYDFGLQPACVWCQLTPEGVLLVLRELVTWTGRGAEIVRDSAWMGEQVSTISARCYPDFAFEDYADPAGWSRAQNDMSQTCVRELTRFGIQAAPGPVSFEERRTVTTKALSTLRAGVPALVIDPACEMLIEGFGGAYKYRQSGSGDRAVLIQQAEKNAHSHVMNALEYVIGSVLPAIGVMTVGDGHEDEDEESDEDYLSQNRAGLYY